MNIETTRGIAARIWGDPDYSQVEMDATLAEEIARKLLKCAQRVIGADELTECPTCSDLIAAGICALECEYGGKPAA